MPMDLASLFREQFAGGFADLADARASVRIPVSERLLNEVIARAMPPDGPLRFVRVRPRDGDRFDVSVKLARPDFLPPFSVTATVERQPVLPGSPVLLLRLSSIPGLVAAAGFGASFLNRLPPGVSIDGNLVRADLRVLLRRGGVDAAWPFVERVHVRSLEGHAVLELDIHVRR